MDSLRDYIIDFIVNRELLPESLTRILIIIVTVILWLFIGSLINYSIRKSLTKYFKIKHNDKRSITVGNMLGNLIRIIIWFVIIVIILAELDVQITPIIASAGVFGIALGFGAQSIVKDFLAGFFLILEKAYYVGDIIEVDGFKGTVTEMGLRTTYIKNWKGIVKIVNNGDIRNLLNFSKSDSIAIVDFGVSYSTNLNIFSEIMPSLLDDLEAKYDMIIEKPKFLGVTALADSSINLRIIAKTVSNEQFQVERDIRKDLIEYLVNNKVEIPFPQIVVHNAKS